MQAEGGDQAGSSEVQPPQQTKTWVDVQKKTFTGWANQFLKERILKINDLQEDMQDGVMLIHLLELISNKKFPRFNKPPVKMRVQKMENCNWALDFIRKEGLRLVGIGANDIVDGNLKLILGLIWTLILRYQIQQITPEDGNASNNSPKAALLEWVRNRVRPYGVEVKDFTESWKDGRALSALTDSLEPGTINMDELTRNPYTDTENAMDKAQDKFQIPKIMDAADLVNIPDELSVMTYLSYFRDYAAEADKRREDAESQLLMMRQRNADPAQCIAYGPGLEGGISGQDAPFTIEARNFFGDALANGGEQFTVEIVGEDGTVVLAEITDTENGKYEVKYRPTRPINYTVSISVRGAQIKDSPYQVTIKGASPAYTIAEGPGLERGSAQHPAKFKIRARDQNGQPLAAGGDTFEVRVARQGDEALAEVSVTDNGDGTYDVSYVAEQSGVYSIDVLLRGEQISNLPVNAVIMGADPAASYAEGPGLHGAQEGKEATFTIFAKDVDGNQRNQGGDDIKVLVRGPEGDVAATVKDNGDGTYTALYQPTAPGKYDVHVDLWGLPLKDTPVTVSVKSAPTAANSYAEGPGLQAGQATKPAEFTIFAKDKDGNGRSDGGDAFTVNVIAPNGAPAPQVDIRDNNDGTYSVVYHPQAPGEYTVNVELEGQPISNSPASVRIRPAPDAAQSYAEGQGLTGRIVDNEPAEFTIHAVDAEGNPLVEGGDSFEVEIDGPAPVNPVVTDNGDGTYLVRYEPTYAGKYRVNVKQEGKPIKDMPVEVEVKEGTDSDQSAFGSFSFTLWAKNRNGEPKTFGGDRFEVSITGPAEHIELAAIDNQDGSYTAKYSLVGSGRFVTAVKLNGKHIEGSPFKQVLGNGKAPKDIPVFTTTATANM